jgi:RNA polymerase subunit RPABC4/transcription elongation factor Spt4
MAMKKENIVKKICNNCSSYEYGQCIKHDKKTKKQHSCKDYSPDPHRFCPICGSKATDNNSLSLIICNEDIRHFASYWDYHWIILP